MYSWIENFVGNYAAKAAVRAQSFATARATARRLYQQGFHPAAIAAASGVSPETLRRWIAEPV